MNTRMVPIEHLPISCRAFNLLVKAGIRNYGELADSIGWGMLADPLKRQRGAVRRRAVLAELRDALFHPEAALRSWQEWEGKAS